MVAVVAICGKGSLDRDTCSPALAIELKLDSGLDCFKNAMESGGLEMAPDREFEIVTGSLLDCINAAMDNGCFSPAWKG